jgi:alanyl-tRNA synthetase
MMTSAQIRQSFLDFFKSKRHTIVPSSSLLPDSPNLLFTNAGMNQFVPIFLGQTKCPYKPGRAADTQKCIRAGGKHNDLEDVGLDTYHHTFFEMLGNWSFGDYFKKEAIEWAWELVVEQWKFPKERLYATIYNPDKSQEEAWNCWAEKFRAAGLDPAVHIVYGDKKDNFWMMGDTGPCGPCSELHVDLTPGGDTNGSLVNKGDARCIEIWNLVFIQFNANPGGKFSLLPARHVDTGMGFERVTAIIQGTKNFKDFARAKISNYETDIFRPIFDALEKLSGKKYGSTLPKSGSAGDTKQETIDVAFRVIADHIRTLSFAIADGIHPGNTDRNYVLRRILRRAVRYGRTLGFHEPFFYKLVDVLADTMGDVFPEIRARKKNVQDVIRTEEEAFNKTLDSGLQIFDQLVALHERISTLSEIIKPAADRLAKNLSQPEPKKIPFLTFAEDVKNLCNAVIQSNPQLWQKVGTNPEQLLISIAQKLPDALDTFYNFEDETGKDLHRLEFLDKVFGIQNCMDFLNKPVKVFWGSSAFLLYDTYGFPLDLTELMARERGLTVDKEGFEKLMEEQRTRARAAQRKTVVEMSKFDINRPTEFRGYDTLSLVTKTAGVTGLDQMRKSVSTEATPFYAEMGGQVGDSGIIGARGQVWRIVNTIHIGPVFCHVLSDADQKFDLLNTIGEEVELKVDVARRQAIQRHHTVTHLLHWALHEVVSKDASQKGSFVGPDKLTFDFNSAPLTSQQVADIEKLVNERIVENASVSWTEVPYAEVKSRKDVMQFFGDKYGDTVRVVQIGGHAKKLDGYSMELCGGTHTRATGEIGLFRIVGENAIAAGVRRIEAVAGLEAYRKAADEVALIKSLAGKVNSPVHELEKKIESLLEHQKVIEKQFRAAQQREASNAASRLLEEIQKVNDIPVIIHNLGAVDGDFLQSVADSLKESFKGVIVLGGGSQAGSVALVATVTPDFVWKFQAGKIIQQIAPIVGGKGGGKPDNARGGGKDASKLDEALAKVKTLLG